MLFPIRHQMLSRLPYSVLLQCSRHVQTGPKALTNGLKPVALWLIPKNGFGQGRRIPIFGHAPEKSASRYPNFMPFAICVCLGSFLFSLVDWDEFNEMFDIDFFPRLRRFWDTKMSIEYMDRGELRKAAKAPVEDPNFYFNASENKEMFHKAMMESAMKRYKVELQQMAADDPELQALLDGQDESKIKYADKEIFEMKKDWVAKYKSVLNAEDDCVLKDTKNDFIKSHAWQFKAYADTGDFSSIEAEDSDYDSENDAQNMGFRSRKIVEYENRIRQYSTPDKIFRYFATYKVVDEKGEQHIMMTPDDFLRSITPGIKQPENLGLDKYVSLNAGEVINVANNLGMDEESIFYKLSSKGLISFSDYIFLLTVLSTSRRHFEIAFKMFDLNGDGNVDAKEFEVVTNLMKSQTSMGSRHRDHQNTGNTFKGINSGLISYFFGENKEGILTVEKFLEFQRQLQNEILRLEFNRKSSGTTISEKEFADLLIAYAGFPAKKKAKMLKRVKKAFHDEVQGITLEDYLNFYQVLYSINDIDTALTFYHIAGAPIERPTMKHVAHTVSGVELSDHVIDVVFVLFDENGDGKLSNKEFTSVMKQRVMRGLEKPKDTGIGKILSAMAKCASDTTISGVMAKAS